MKKLSGIVVETKTITYDEDLKALLVKIDEGNGKRPATAVLTPEISKTIRDDIKLVAEGRKLEDAKVEITLRGKWQKTFWVYQGKNYNSWRFMAEKAEIKKQMEMLFELDGGEQIQTREEKEKFLRSRGWETWYNPNYWVHPKTIVDKSRQDYTNYGMSLNDAMKFETEKLEPFNGQLLGPFGLRF